MVSKELLDMLVCPDTRQSVRLAPDEVLARLNRRIEAGEARNRAGSKVEEKVEAGLLREDGLVLYPIRDDIPIMLVEEGIDLGESGPAAK
jgi:uncharacterized protein YbaR (Trm112 family)